MEQTYTFEHMSGIKNLVSDYKELRDAYFVAHFGQNSGRAGEMQQAVRLDGMSFFVVRAGKVVFDIDMDRFEAPAPAICVVEPTRRLFITGNSDADMTMLFMSPNFVQNININVSAFNLPSILERPSPVMRMTEAEARVMTNYLELLERNCDSGDTRQLALNVGSSLISALIYEMARMQYRHLETADAGSTRPRTARNGYVRDFIKLVRAHYATERSVGFYASKLFISPKYLSLVVREVTGRSAARWIDEFVIMEAKNMLRFSGKNIQQVAYALNFSNQSSFGKYFKHLTGMSPTEYQKT